MPSYIDIPQSEESNISRIYRCIHMSFRHNPYAKTLAGKILQWVNAWESFYHQPVDKNDLHIFCHVAHRQPELSTVEALKSVEAIQREIGIYIKTADEKFSYEKIDVNRIQLYLDAAKKFPQPNPEEVVVWAQQWAREEKLSKLVREVVTIFPPSYPFHSIKFNINAEGKGFLHISTKTHLSSPYLKSLVSLDYERREHVNNVEMRFDLRNGDTPESIIQKIELFFQILETTLYTQVVVDEKIFEDFRRECQRKIRIFLKNYKEGILDLKYFNDRSTAIDRKNRVQEDDSFVMTKAVDNLDCRELQQLLARGTDPNTSDWMLADSLLSRVVSNLKDYSVHTRLGQLSEKDEKLLYTSWKRIHEGPQVIIAYQEGIYTLYWSEDGKTKKSLIITDSAAIEYLNNVELPYFPRSGASNSRFPSGEKLLSDLVRPYLNNSLGKQQKQKAESMEKMTTLLMAYGADPTTETAIWGTAIEKMIMQSQLSDANFIDNKKSLQNLLRLILRSDRGRSHLNIHSTYYNHFLGEIIVGYQKYLMNGHKVPPTLQAIECIRSHRIPRVKITNGKNASVYLESIPLHTLDQFPQAKQDIIELCKKTFLKDVKMSEEELKKYVEKKLEATHEQSVIDLLYNEEGKVVSFNIADVVPPKKPGDAVLHYIRLAATDKTVRDDFKKLTSIITFQRILYLMQFHEAEVLTAYTAASALSYVLVANLIAYPKYQCLNLSDLLTLYNTFFYGRKIFLEGGRCYFESDLFYDAKPKVECTNNQETVSDSSDIHCRVYNDNFRKSGCSSLVAFWSKPKNIERLSDNINPQLKNLTFQKDIVDLMQDSNNRSLVPCKGRH